MLKPASWPGRVCEWCWIAAHNFERGKDLSLRPMRRSIIAASAVLALGGSLAIAASASAAQIPWGGPTDTGTTSVYGLFNNTYGGLDQADFALSGELSDPAVPTCTPSGPPPTGTCTTFPAETGAHALTSAQALQIAADYTDTTVSDGTTSETPSSATYAAILSGGGDPNYSTDAPAIVAAAESWSELSGLITQLFEASDAANFPGGLYSIDGNLSISSTGTVTAIGQPTAYSITAAVSGGSDHRLRASLRASR